MCKLAKSNLTVAERIKEVMDAKLPPSPKQVSGILAVQVHQLADLDIPAAQRALSSKSHMSGSHTPSTYAQVVSTAISLYFTCD